MISLESFNIFFALAIGLVVGSFLNVVIYRLPRDLSIVKPRSQCPHCSHAIRWYENIPVLSYLALRGRCSACRAAISIRYPIVELITGVLFVATEVRFGNNWVVWIRDWPFVAALVAVTFIDLDHRIIPDEISWGGMAWGILTSWAVPGFGVLPSLLGAAVGFGLFYGFAWAYLKWSGKSGLGGGDIKFLGMLGAFLGPLGVLTTIFMSSILGSLIGIVLGLVQRKNSRGADGATGLMGVAIPYGPFLVVGALYAYLLGDILWSPFTIPI